MDFIRVGGGSFQALSDMTKIFIETDAETFLRPRLRLFFRPIILRPEPILSKHGMATILTSTPDVTLNVQKYLKGSKNDH